MPKPTAAPTPVSSGSSSPDADIANEISNILGDADDPAPGASPVKPAAAPAPEPEPAAAPAPEPEPSAPEPAADGAIPDGITGVAVPAPTPAPADDADADDDDDIPEDARAEGKAKNAWSKIKAEKKELTQRIADLQAQLDAAKNAETPEMQDVLNLKKQLEEKENLIGQLDITKSTEFKTRFDLPMERTLKRGEVTLTRSGMDEASAKQIMQKLVSSNPQEVSDLIADQPIAVQGALMSIASEYIQMQEDRDSAIANWRDTQVALQHTAKRDQEIKLAENIEKDTAEAVQAAVKEGNFLFVSTGGQNQNWDNSVEERVRLVKGILHTSKPAELVKWVVEGVSAKPVRDAYLAERQKVVELTKKLNDITSRAPRAAASGAPVRGTPINASAPKSPDDVIGTIL